ncbi:MAG TPA: family 20 glycosylhydrolase [Microthrixaceae bacterium]|nr:family 20 glycosylhydrolase [Microthrixaceae bacterium]
MAASPTDPCLLPAPRRVELGDRTIEAIDPRLVQIETDRRLVGDGYRLDITADGVRAAAGSAPGAEHARRTLGQLDTACAGRWPLGAIEDDPDLAVRGVMLDVSRDKVPTIETLELIVDQLAAWKVNHLQLYVEHTFVHPGFEDVWADASPLTVDEVAHLVSFAATRHVEVVPNQNCLGHMERYLVHPRLRHLALAPDGFRLLGFLPKPPSTLDPRSEEAFGLVSRLVGDWIDAVPGAARMHVGLDEPWELGPELLDDYQRWARRLRDLPPLDGREVLMWGDILAKHPALLDGMPDDVTVCEWGYEAGHPWTERLAALAERGVERWVAPGTSSWLSLLGRTTNMRDDVGQAVDAALADGGVGGLLSTDWGDWGHHQYLPVSWAGLAWSAAQAWCRASNRDLDLAHALDVHAFESTGPGYGAALCALGDAHRHWGSDVPNVAASYLGLWLPQLPIRGVERGAPDAVAAALEDALGLGDPGAEVATTVELARLLLDEAAARLDGDGSLGSVREALRREFAERLSAISVDHERHWLTRNRPGGLDDSLAWFDHLADAWRTGVADPDWSGPLQIRV